MWTTAHHYESFRKTQPQYGISNSLDTTASITFLFRQNHTDVTEHVENIIRKSKIVKYIECSNKYGSTLQNVGLRTKKHQAIINCRDYKHESKF